MKNAIVTGGTKGIGLGIAKMLMHEGYHVVVTHAHDVASAKTCQDQLSSICNEYEIVKCNQSSSEEVHNFTTWVKVKFSHIDCLVCNAGTTLRKELTEMSNEEWEQVMQVNVNSNVYIIRDLFELFTPPCLGSDSKSEHRSIVLIGSMMGVYPHGTSLAYGVTKSAVHALATNLVKCFASKQVTVNAIAPGFVETEWQKTKPQEIRNNICKKTALNRFATVEEIADAVLFCIKNPYVNGSIIEVSGGYSYR